MRGESVKQIGGEGTVPSVRISEAAFPAPFASGLEYSVPARGGWTIVHVGMLLPEAHEIFVCAAGCLRGVVLSAAEMGLSDRFSTVAIEEHNVTDGDMEELIITGVTDILNRLPKRPRAVLVYSSCLHHFLGCDLALCYDTLRERFPEVDFADCYMIPTMRKSGLTPDQIMRRQLYSLLRPADRLPRHCAVVGNCFSMDQSSDLVSLIRSAGWTLHQITECRTYEEYQQMAQCELCISTQPVARAGAEALAERLGMRHLYLPAGFDANGIKANLARLAEALGCDRRDSARAEEKAERALQKVREVIGAAPIYIDHTVSPRPLGLARLLVGHGFCVSGIFADAFSPEEREDFLWLREQMPDLELLPTVHPAMRRYPLKSGEKVLALGQKAAYFRNTPYFVDLVEGGGLYGFDGICRLCDRMTEAFSEPKDTQKRISQKGSGWKSCI